MSEETIIMYTDGACSGNPGPGGFGTILLFKGRRRELSEGYRWTTNNRMEMLALLRGLQVLKRPCKLHVYIDSTYVMNAFKKGWLENWKKKGWKTASKKPVHNRDLWELLDEQVQRHEVEFTWVKGHADNEENNRCDELGVQARTEDATRIDTVYEQENPYKP